MPNSVSNVKAQLNIAAHHGQEGEVDASECILSAIRSLTKEEWNEVKSCDSGYDLPRRTIGLGH